MPDRERPAEGEMIFTRNDFFSLVRYLRSEGYTVKVSENFDGIEKRHSMTGLFAFSGQRKKVIFGFAWNKNKNESNFYPYITDALSADHRDCFDKWSKCPMRISLPQKHEDIAKWLKLLSKKESLELSNAFESIPGIPNDYNATRVEK